MGITATYRGESQVIDPTGAVLFAATAAEGLHTISLDINTDQEKRLLGVKFFHEVQAVEQILHTVDIP